MADEIKDINDLNLIFDPDFISTAPVYTASEMILIFEPMLAYWNRQKLEDPPPYTEWEEFVLD